MRDRRRPGEDGHRRELPRELLQRDVADRPGQHVDEPPQRRVRDRRRARAGRTGSRGSGRLRRGWSSTIETPVTAVRRASAAATRPASTPVGESDGASSDGAGRGRRDVLGRAGTEERAGTAALRRLGRRDADDEVGVEQRGVDAHGRRAVELEEPEVVARRVVHLDRAAEVARAGGAQHRLELAAAGPALEPAGDQDRVLLGGHPEPLELVDHGRDRLLARVDRGAREGQRARLDDDRDPAAARGEVGEPRAGERIAERLADRGGDVAQRIERRRGHQQQRVVVHRDERHPRAGEERDACHHPVAAVSARRSRGTGGRTSGGTRASARCATTAGSSPASR